MGLFDRIFSIGAGKEEEPEGVQSEYAEGTWETDTSAREAIERHHDVIERRLDEHAQQFRSGSVRALEGGWTAPVAGWDDHDGLGQVLARLESHSDPHVRALAARTLAMMPGRRAMEALAEALEDPDVVVRDAARDALIKLGAGTLLT